jgi:hypothetical protein
MFLIGKHFIQQIKISIHLIGVKVACETKNQSLWKTCLGAEGHEVNNGREKLAQFNYTRLLEELV